jgi:preprotein translocase subunit SecD
LGNADIAAARAVRDVAGRPAVEVVFAAGSRKAVTEFSRTNVGKVAAIFVGGKLVSAPTITAELSGKAEITGEFTEDEAERIAKGIMAE